MPPFFVPADVPDIKYRNFLQISLGTAESTAIETACVHNDKIIFAGASGLLWRYTASEGDAMGFFEKLPTPLGSTARISGLCSTGSRLFIGQQNVGILYSEDDGDSWVLASPQFGWAPGGMDSNRVDTIVAGSFSGTSSVYSTDNGNTWQTGSFGTFAGTVNLAEYQGIRYFPETDTWIRLGTGQAISSSLDGITWSTYDYGGVLTNNLKGIAYFNGAYYSARSALGLEPWRFDSLVADPVPVLNTYYGDQSLSTINSTGMVYVYDGVMYIGGIGCIMQTTNGEDFQAAPLSTVGTSSIAGSPRMIGNGSDLFVTSNNTFLHSLVSE